MKKDCKKCIYRRITWDEHGAPTIDICHGKYRSKDEAVAAIKDNACDMYEEGHRLYETNIDIDKLPASKMYIVDPMDFSKEPIAICNHHRVGMKACYRGEGQYCYCRLNCTSKMSLNDPTKMTDGSRSFLTDILVSAGIDETQLNI